VVDEEGQLMLATVHPSSILRAPDPRAREDAMDGFVADLRRAVEVVRT
jgi:uracil-DNA glycosylase